MALERINWPRDAPRWFWMLWRPLPGHQDLNEAEQADRRATFQLILERCDPNIRAAESRQTMLHALGWACRWGRVTLVELLLARGAGPIEGGAEPRATPLAWAERRHHAGITSILRQHGAGRSR